VKSWEVVGYTFRADTYCPAHIADALPTGEGEAYDGWHLLVPMSAEQNLDEIALAFGIDRHDEATFDTGDFPKVVFADQAGDDTCSVCAEPLI